MCVTGGERDVIETSKMQIAELALEMHLFWQGLQKGRWPRDLVTKAHEEHQPPVGKAASGPDPESYSYQYKAPLWLCWVLNLPLDFWLTLLYLGTWFCFGFLSCHSGCFILTVTWDSTNFLSKRFISRDNRSLLSRCKLEMVSFTA